MKVVLDTNVFLLCLSSKSRFHPILDAILSGALEIAITNDILFEYAEIAGRHMGRDASDLVLNLFTNLPNVTEVNLLFHWDLIPNDKEDNKFVDCAIAANVHYLVTNDRHFDILRTLQFPSVELLTSEQFLELILAGR